MKKLFVVLSILLFVSTVSAQGLNLESFRQQATYIIRDDLDYAINGTDIFEVDGARIFTNLSNLSTGTEELMGYNSDNTFVIGYVSPEFWGLKSALFWGTMKDLDPDFLGIDVDGDGWDDLWGDGFLSGVWHREWDANGDGSIDFIDYRYVEEAGEDSDLESDILVNIGKDMGVSAFALTYRRVADKFTEDNSDSLYFDREDYSTGDLTEFYREDEADNYIYTSPSNQFNLAYTSPFMSWDLRGDFYFNMSNIEDKWTSNYHYFENLAPPPASITDTELDTTYSAGMDKYSNNEAGIALRLKNTDPVLTWEVSGRFGMNFGSGDYEDSYFNFTETHDMNAGNVDSDIYAYTDQYIAPISVSGMNMGIGGRMEWQLASNVRFGLGAGFNSSRLTREYDQDYTNIERIEYDDGDLDPADPDDYVDITQSGYSSMRTYETIVDAIYVPAGIEINVGKNKDWFLRFGALAIKENINTKNIEEIDEVQREVHTITYGDGTTTTTYEDVEYESTKENDYSENQTVNFAYGLGWKPSDNLSIDLLGMFDVSGVELLSTDWFQSLKLSATVSY